MNKELNDLIQEFKDSDYRNIEFPTYEQREKSKDLCWKIIGFLREEGEYFRASVFLLNGVIKSHYWRAREQFLSNKTLLRKVVGKSYSPGYELEFDFYIQNWLYSNHDILPLNNEFGQRVIKEFENLYHYKKIPNKYLPKGCTTYQDKEKQCQN